jgi:acetoin utilization deacetylase AcuC-like enzyme
MNSSKLTGLVWSDRFLAHDTGAHHPERPARLSAIQDRLSHSGLLSKLHLIEPQQLDLSLATSVHSEGYLARFQQRAEGQSAFVDSPECPLSEATYEVARLAAGGAIAAVEAVMAGQIANAFCPVRPPGHHAERQQALGFCYLNNIAIAASHLQSQHGLKRVAILDWDVHHGNGTQHQFEDDASVLFCSIHQHPRTLFPGTGFAEETGQGEGTGKTLNCPVMPGSDDDLYKQLFDEKLLPALQQFDPDFILVSAGFDPHMDDPLANIELSTEMFEWMTQATKKLAAECCEGRMVTLLEGGYQLDALADCTQAHVEALMNQSG